MKPKLAMVLAVLVAVYMRLLFDGSIQTFASLQGNVHEGSEPSFLHNLAIWSEPLFITSSIAGLRGPSAVTNGSNQGVHLVWEEMGTVHYALLDELGRPIEQTAFRGDSPCLALDGNDLPHIVYADTVASGQLRTQIFHRARGFQGWDDAPPMRVISTTGVSTDPDISISPLVSPAIHVAYAEKPGGGAIGIYHARSLDGSNGMFWTWEPIGAGYAPAITLAPDGRIWVAWQRDSTEPGNRTADIYVASWNGEIWSEPVNISRTPADDSRNPSIGCDNYGNVHLIWQEGPTAAIYYVANVLGVWSEPIVLANESTIAQARLVTAPNGHVYVAWGYGARLEVRRRQAGWAWESLEGIVVGSAVNELTIAVDGQGTIYVIWTNVRNGTPPTQSLFFSRRVDDGSLTPTLTLTPSIVPSPSLTDTPVSGETATPLPTATSSPTPCPSATLSPTATRSPTPTLTRPEYIFLPVILRGHAIGLQTQSRHSGMEETSIRASSAITPPAWIWSSTNSIGPSSDDSHAATVAIGADGRVYAVWEERLSSGRSILRFSIGMNGIWSTPTDFFLGEDPDLAVGPDGQLHLVYANRFLGNYEIYHAVWTGNGWSAAENVSQTSGPSTQPAIAVKSDNSLFVVWTDSTEGFNRIYSAWRADGIWNTYFVPHSSGGTAPDITVGEGDRVWVTWQVLDDDRYEVYAIFGDGRNNWNPWGAMSLSISRDIDSIRPQLAGIPGRGAFCVWQENIGAGEVYYADNLDYADYWSEPINLSENTTRSEQPSIAASAVGDVHVVWSEDSQLLHRYRISFSPTWSASGVVNNTPNANEVALAVALNRSLHVLWSQPTTAENRDIYYCNGAWDWPNRLWLPLLLAP